jgi:hypothetical protein
VGLDDRPGAEIFCADGAGKLTGGFQDDFVACRGRCLGRVASALPPAATITPAAAAVPKKSRRPILSLIRDPPSRKTTKGSMQLILFRTRMQDRLLQCPEPGERSSRDRRIF